VNTPDPNEAPSDRPDVYTPDEAAVILKVSADWLKRRAAARKIPFTMLGGSYRFSSAHLQEIIRLNEHLPADHAGQPKRGRSRRVPRTGRQQAGAAEVTQLRPRPASARRKNQSAA
jgi:excisionase family DNA binding protein